MHLLYIGYYTSEDLLYEIQDRGINNMSVARQKYETNMLTGIIEECGETDVHLVSYVPVDNSIQIPEYSEIGGKQVKHIPINKHDFRSMIKAKDMFREYLLSLGDSILLNLHILMYEVNPLFLLVLMQYNHKYNFKITTLCAELSILRRINNFKDRIRNIAFSFFEKRFDAFILFAKPMEEVLKCNNKPHVVIEGIAPDLFGSPKVMKRNIVMYAGGFGSDNNLGLLIDVCNEIEELDELWICGTGKDLNIVQNACLKSNKIKYLGMLPNDEVRKLEIQAKVLVNLRNPSAMITKYSFPSKLLEYIASGTLVISTRLEGVPEEYYNYLYPVETMDKTVIKDSIRKILNMDQSEYTSKALLAQDFIITKKNKNIQARRILDFLHML